ncbi:hypothetical protein RAS1_18750 [Phycisphaerae bacterium RAS1]|nr:hypothetical protein RAS1_18750 [Phycisphaerae bacterium RAS1]
MQHDDNVYIGHMLETARKAVDRVAGKSRALYDAEEDLRIVLAHWVQIIGEAASKVSEVTRLRYPAIPWRRIVGMRHRIVHDYMNIDADILWQVVTESLPELIVLLDVPSADKDTP